VEKKTLGFLLKRFFPKKQKLSLLCAHCGRMEATTSNPMICNSLWPGMLISFNYRSNQQKTIYFVSNVEIVMNPEFHSFIDINTLHHILEICYYFVPIENPSHQVFSHLYNFFLLYKLESTFQTHQKLIHQVYIIKLLTLLGFYPEKELLAYLGLYEDLTSLYVDFDDPQKVKSLTRKLHDITKRKEKKINTWILGCIESHPYFKNFKTINL